MECKEVTIRNYGWCDYVFEPDYKLMSLAELKSYVMPNKHLPEVPTEADINANGMDVFETQKLLLKKVEELTLYMISLDEQITALKKKNENITVFLFAVFFSFCFWTKEEDRNKDRRGKIWQKLRP